MSKKVTIRDIAKEAGVSIATVSYVLNNREDQSISEATRQKILQIVNLHQYRINFTAKCISSGKTNIITLFVGKSKNPLCKAEAMLIAEKLYKFLSAKGYWLQIASGKEVKRFSSSDAVVCYNVDEAFFHELGEANFCPLIALDAKLIDNELFYQIYVDYDKVKSVGDRIYGADNYEVVSLPLNSEALKQEVTRVFPRIIFATGFGFSDVIANRNAVVLGETLGEYAKRFAKDVVTIAIFNQEQMEKLWQCLDIAINRLDAINHDIKL